MKHGIDISEWQGADFKLSDYNPDFVIIRLGYAKTPDKYAESYISQAITLGIPWGVYWYSYALDLWSALGEASYCLELLNGRKPPFGVWFDMEDADGYKGRNGMPSKQTITEMCNGFCSTISRNGLLTGVYASKHWFDTLIGDISYHRWIAAWGANDGVTYPDMQGQCLMHQYRGYPLDLNFYYGDDKDVVPYGEIDHIDIEQVVDEVMANKWGTGEERKQRLGNWFYSIVQTHVNKRY